jgi:hypothetical protein
MNKLLKIIISLSGGLYIANYIVSHIGIKWWLIFGAIKITTFAIFFDIPMMVKAHKAKVELLPGYKNSLIFTWSIILIFIYMLPFWTAHLISDAIGILFEKPIDENI